MLQHLRANLWLLLLTVALCTVLYPLGLWAVGQGVFRHQAQGSLIDTEGKPAAGDQEAVGSRLIAQPFTGPGYFHPRPSAAKYDATASGASNWGPGNPQLRERVVKDLEGKAGLVPADLVTASGSGLDPHITLAGARHQLGRVAGWWAGRTKRDDAEVKQDIEGLLRRQSQAPLGGLAGADLVNVLELNLSLRRHFASAPRLRVRLR